MLKPLAVLGLGTVANGGGDALDELLMSDDVGALDERAAHRRSPRIRLTSDWISNNAAVRSTSSSPINSPATAPIPRERVAAAVEHV